jgi:hypothetical protein
MIMLKMLTDDDADDPVHDVDEYDADCAPAGLEFFVVLVYSCLCVVLYAHFDAAGDDDDIDDDHDHDDADDGDDDHDHDDGDAAPAGLEFFVVLVYSCLCVVLYAHFDQAGASGQLAFNNLANGFISLYSLSLTVNDPDIYLVRLPDYAEASTITEVLLNFHFALARRSVL